MQNPSILLSLALFAAGSLSADVLARDEGRRDGRHGHSTPAQNQHIGERGPRQQAQREGRRHGPGYAQDSRRHADAGPARHRDPAPSRHDGRRDGNRHGGGYAYGGHDRHRGHSRPAGRYHGHHYDSSRHYRHAPRHYPARYYAPQRYRAPVRYVYPTGHRLGGWHVGTYLPRHYYAPSYYVDYRHYGLVPPPRGHYWVRIDNDVVLVAIATGLVTRVLYDLFYW